MGELKATPETNARIASAMGWHPPEKGDWTTLYWFDPQGKWRKMPLFTTDYAQVVPMMEQLGELVDGPIDLSPPARNYRARWMVNLWAVIRHFEAETANLAVGEALLSIAGEAHHA